MKATTTKDGHPCEAHYVDPKDWDAYEGDHYPIPDQFDCRLVNVRPRARDPHRSEDRLGWPGKTLPPSERGLKRPAAVVLRAAKAKAKPKAKPKAAPARSRSWQ
jgi:hypothetical protein